VLSDRLWDDPRCPAGMRKATKEIQFLGKHEELLVEQADVLERLAAEHQAGTAQVVGRAGAASDVGTRRSPPGTTRALNQPSGPCGKAKPVCCQRPSALRIRGEAAAATGVWSRNVTSVSRLDQETFASLLIVAR